MTPEMQKIIDAAHPISSIPGWRVSLEGVPVGLITRKGATQRPSQLKRFIAKAGNFKPAVAGLGVQVVPNGAKFNVVVGGHRVELAERAHGKNYLMPMMVYEREMSDKKMAQIFVHDLARIRLGVEPEVRISGVAEEPWALDVLAAIQELQGNSAQSAMKSIRCKAEVDGSDLLRQVVTTVKRFFPKEIKDVPGVVLRGIALVLIEKKQIAKKWRSRPVAVLTQSARTRHARYGGHGSVAFHVAALLSGGRT